ncbi:UNVERIFIED_CONTAM: hypothetical protein FKN15_010958 [Acipenser sinensis]
MVRNVDDLDFCLQSHPQSILEGLNSLRSQPKLSDVTLCVASREFHCHRSVLALCSLYFHSMFSGDFVESIAARVELRDVDPDVLDTILDFAYTGKLTINQGNVEGLIRTSSQLQFVTVRKACSRYLQHQINATNCLGILKFGEIHGCPEVVAKARGFLLENFEAVAQGEEFLLLEKERLAACLKEERLQMREERTRVEAVLRWVRHNEDTRATHLPKLLGLVRLSLLSQEYITETLLKDKLVLETPACREAVERNRRGGCRLLGRAVNTTEGEYNGTVTELLIPAGGSRGSRTNTWSTTQTWKYDSQQGKWTTVAPMLRPRTNHTTAVLNGEIYAIGGTTLDFVEVEHYDPYNDSWSLTSPTLKYVSNFTATGCMGKLYVIGSCAAKYNVLAMQCYNPVIDAWSLIASPFIPKYLSGPCSVSLDGVIYLIGDNTKKVYMYDPDANMWQKVQLLHMLHENGGMVVLGGRLFVTGGHWKGLEGEYRVEMEVYDRGRNAWHMESSLPRLWLYSGSCSIFLDASQWVEPFPVDQA